MKLNIEKKLRLRLKDKMAACPWVKVSLHIRGLLRVFTPPETSCETHGEQHSCDLSPHWR